MLTMNDVWCTLMMAMYEEDGNNVRCMMSDVWRMLVMRYDVEWWWCMVYYVWWWCMMCKGDAWAMMHADVARWWQTMCGVWRCMMYGDAVGCMMYEGVRCIYDDDAWCATYDVRWCMYDVGIWDNDDHVRCEMMMVMMYAYVRWWCCTMCDAWCTMYGDVWCMLK